MSGASTDASLPWSLLEPPMTSIVPRDAGIERHVGLPVAPVPLPAALVLDRHDPVAQADLGDRPAEAGAVQVVERGSSRGSGARWRRT